MFPHPVAMSPDGLHRLFAKRTPIIQDGEILFQLLPIPGRRQCHSH